MSADMELHVSLMKTPIGITRLALRPNDASSPFSSRTTLQMETALLDE
jgi:hypothetical protein